MSQILTQCLPTLGYNKSKSCFPYILFLVWLLLNFKIEHSTTSSKKYNLTTVGFSSLYFCSTLS